MLFDSAALLQEFSGEFTKYDRYTNEKVTGRIHKSVSATGKSVIEGTLSYTMDDGNRAVVTLLDHRAYIEVFNDTVSATVPQRVTCMPPNLVPPFGDVDEVFSTSSLVPVEHLDESNPGTAQCAEAGHRWLIKWGVQEFLYCQPSDDVHRVRGSRAALCCFARSLSAGSLCCRCLLVLSTAFLRQLPRPVRCRSLRAAAFAVHPHQHHHGPACTV